MGSFRAQSGGSLTAYAAETFTAWQNKILTPRNGPRNRRLQSWIFVLPKDMQEDSDLLHTPSIRQNSERQSERRPTVGSMNPALVSR